MKISYKWLQTYFKTPLPTPEKVTELFNFHTFEVESIEKKQDDVILDVKVLPDRAPYCLSHVGIAKELSALIDNEFIPRNFEPLFKEEDLQPIYIKSIDQEYCDRFLLCRVLNVSNNKSPEWLRHHLEVLGQRSINLVVDLLNFVMLDIGFPLHAYDGAQVEGNISVRRASESEKITILDGKEINLSKDDYVITDEKGALAIAGIKGGKRAEIGSHTNHIILEAGHFDGAILRKSSKRVGIRNESSKRYENSVSAGSAKEAMIHFLNLLYKEDTEADIGNIVEENFYKPEEKTITVPIDFFENYLGKKFEIEEILDVLNKASIPAERIKENILIKVPAGRLDLSIKEDVLDEVGRILGYEKIEGVLPQTKIERKINKEVSYKNEIRNFLVEKGFSEVYTYAFDEEGEVLVANPLASDKGVLRKNLSKSIEKKLLSNLNYADLLGLEKIKIFEIGNVFSKGGENTSLCIGIAHKKISKNERPNDEIKIVRDELFKVLGFDPQILCTVDDSGGIISHEGKQVGVTNQTGGIMEIDLDFIISKLPDVSNETELVEKEGETKFKPISAYPFASRDIAVFVPEGVLQNEVLEVITKHSNDLLVKHTLFDEFSKEDPETGKNLTSYAYRLVFQSYTETLKEVEINKMMENITGALNAEKGWKVR